MQVKTHESLENEHSILKVASGKRPSLLGQSINTEGAFNNFDKEGVA